MDLTQLLVLVGVAVIVICVVWWLMSQVPLDNMARKVITIAVVVVVALVCIWFLLSLGGVHGVKVGERALQSHAILCG